MDYLPLFAAFAVSAAAVGLFSYLAKRVGAVARSVDDRWHTSGDIPHLGGLGILVGILPWFPLEQGLVLAGFCLIGAVDDIHPLAAAAKAALMLVPSTAAWWITGEIWVGVSIWFVANAVNLLDHADGLAAATVLFGVAFAGTTPGLAVAGACLAFLLYNYPPARSFMGDGGSLMLGAALILVWHDWGPPIALAWCAVPVADAVFVSLKRIARGQRPWVGGKDHSGHILLRAGVPPRMLPPMYAAAAIVLGFAGQAIFAAQ